MTKHRVTKPKVTTLQLSEEYPKIAVCLAAFNGTHWLTEQLDSILAQTGVAVTVFVSVDVSNDGTEDWVDVRAQADSRIVVLPHGENFGGAARNFFRILREVDLSKFDYVSFADQDDIWLPKSTSCKILKKLRAAPPNCSPCGSTTIRLSA